MEQVFRDIEFKGREAEIARDVLTEADRCGFDIILFAMVAAFLVLRFLNLYGDPATWQHGATFGRTLISFLNVTKNPPSLIFVLMTIGPALILLSLFDSGAPKFTQA